MSNAGPDAAPYVDTTINLPPTSPSRRSTPARAHAWRPRRTRSRVTWAPLASGASTTIVVRAEAGVAPGPASVTAAVSSGPADPHPGGDTASATIQVVSRPDTPTSTYSSGPMSGPSSAPTGRPSSPIDVPDNAGILDVDVRVHMTALVGHRPHPHPDRPRRHRGEAGRRTGSGGHTRPILRIAPAPSPSSTTRLRSPSGCARDPFTGIHRPVERLAALRGGPTVGQWRLRVEDTWSFSTATLHCWEIDVLKDTANVPPPPPPPPPSAPHDHDDDFLHHDDDHHDDHDPPGAATSVPDAPDLRQLRRHVGGLRPKSVVSGDFTGDGRADVAMTTGHGFEEAKDHGLFLFAQTAAGGLDPPVHLTTHATHNLDEMGSAAGDVDGDGRSDVVVASDKGFDVYLQRGGTLAPAYLIEYYGPQEVHLADVNGDGRLDLVVITLTQVVSLLGRGDGTFEPAREVYPTRLAEIEVADLTGDGLPDVVGFVGKTLYVIGGRGDGTWAPPVAYLADPNDYPPGGVTVGDFNGDGRADVAWSVSGSGTPAHVKVFTQTAAGTLAPAVRYAATAGPVDAADLDGDGRTDLVTVYGGSRVGVLSQQADGTLAVQRQFTTPYSGSAPYKNGVTTGDVNGDGLPDLLLADGNSGLSVLRSTTQLRTWGLGHLGQLGTGPAAVGSTTGVPTPSATPVLDGVATVVAGGFHNLALGRDGVVRTWGLNHVGQLGLGSTADGSSPAPVARAGPTPPRWPPATTTAWPSPTTARCGRGAGTSTASWATAPPPTVWLR